VLPTCRLDDGALTANSAPHYKIAVDERDAVRLTRNMSRGSVGASSYGMYHHVHQQSFQVSSPTSPYLYSLLAGCHCACFAVAPSHLYIFCDEHLIERRRASPRAL